MPVYLDSNVFIYAAGAQSPMKAACVALLRRIAAGALEGATSAEVVQEVHHVFRRRGRLEEGVALGREIARLFPGLLPVTRDDVLRSGEILAARPQLSPRDALHAATAMNAGISVIVSADLDFDQVEGITRVDPVDL